MIEALYLISHGLSVGLCATSSKKGLCSDRSKQSNFNSQNRPKTQWNQPKIPQNGVRGKKNINYLGGIFHGRERGSTPFQQNS